MFLAAPEGIQPQEINFNLFKMRLLQTLTSASVCPDLTSIIELGRDGTDWGMIVATKSQQVLPYKIGSNTIIPRVDRHGQLQFRHVTARSLAASEVSSSATSFQQATLSAEAEINIPTESSNDETLQPTGIPTEFPDLRELNWDQHRGNWWEILKESEIAIDEYVS